MISITSESYTDSPNYPCCKPLRQLDSKSSIRAVFLCNNLILCIVVPNDALRDWHPAKLRMPDYQGRIQQAAAIQIGHQAGDRFIDFERVLPVIVDDAFVVPRS